MLTATCHCGAVTLQVPGAPDTLTSCNCSICRRSGALWAYYRRSEVTVTFAAGATSEYIWGDRCLRLVRCATCGCVTHSEHIQPGDDSRVGVNARNFDPEVIASVRVRRLDGAGSWEYFD